MIVDSKSIADKMLNQNREFFRLSICLQDAIIQIFEQRIDRKKYRIKQLRNIAFTTPLAPTLGYIFGNLQ